MKKALLGIVLLFTLLNVNLLSQDLTLSIDTVCTIDNDNYMYGKRMLNISSNDEFIASSKLFGFELAIYDTKSCELLWKIEQRKNKGVIYCYSFSPDDKYLAAGCGRYLKIWHIGSKTLAAMLISSHDDGIINLFWGPNESEITTVSASGLIEYWNLENRNKLTEHRLKIDDKKIPIDWPSLSSLSRNGIIVAETTPRFGYYVMRVMNIHTSEEIFKHLEKNVLMKHVINNEGSLLAYTVLYGDHVMQTPIQLYIQKIDTIINTSYKLCNNNSAFDYKINCFAFSPKDKKIAVIQLDEKGDRSTLFLIDLDKDPCNVLARIEIAGKVHDVKFANSHETIYLATYNDIIYVDITNQDSNKDAIPGIRTRLIELKSLFEKGIISQEEYDLKRKQILNEI